MSKAGWERMCCKIVAVKLAEKVTRNFEELKK
jgi:hypothetical protein